VASRKIDWEDVKLDSYEREIEDNLENAKPVEDEEYWKELIVQAAQNTVSKGRRLILEFQSEDAKEKAVQLLKEMLKGEFRVVNSG